MPNKPSSPGVIDFVIAAYNAAGTIARTLDALRAQSDPRWNAIVVDDGSTDHTAEIVASYHDARVRVLSQPNRGPSAARNLGYSASKSPTVCFLDSDDTIHPDFVAQMVPMAQRSPVGASCGYDYVDPDARVLFRVPALSSDRLTRASMLALDPPAIMSMVYRRDALDRLIGASALFNESLCAFEDWDMLDRLVQSDPGGVDRFGRVERSLASYYCEPNSLSSDCSRVWAAGSQILRARCVDEHEFQSFIRTWSIGMLGGCVLADDYSTGRAIQAVIGRILPGDIPRLARSLRWHAMRRHAIGLHEVEAHHSQMCAAIIEHLGDDALIADLEACLRSSSIARIDGLLRHASTLAGTHGRIVIYGLGRNADQIIQSAHRLGLEISLTDDQQGCMAADPRRIEPGSISASDVVIVTPLNAESIFETLKAINPRGILPLQASTHAL